MELDLTADFFADVDSLRLPLEQQVAVSPPPSASPKSTRGRIKGEFIKGPIPLPWLSAAARLSGKAPLAVGLAIWFEAGQRRSNEFILTSRNLGPFQRGAEVQVQGPDSIGGSRLDSGISEAQKEPCRHHFGRCEPFARPKPSGCYRNGLGRFRLIKTFLGDRICLSINNRREQTESPGTSWRGWNRAHGRLE